MTKYIRQQSRIDPFCLAIITGNIILNFDSRIGGCGIIGKTTHIFVSVIPGLIRNPLFFQSVTLLDA
jgi:hypothetical protein